MLLNSLLSDEHEIVHQEPRLQAESYTALKAPRVLLDSLLSDEHEIVHQEHRLQAALILLCVESTTCAFGFVTVGCA